MNEDFEWFTCSNLKKKIIIMYFIGFYKLFIKFIKIWPILKRFFLDWHSKTS
jgi:uncharacterized membrane protein